MTSQKDRQRRLKGLVLAAGKGTRLRPFTHGTSKAVIPVANKPILFYIIEDMVNSGITDIGIVIGKNGEEISGRVGDGSKWGASITYITQEEPKGLADAVMKSRGYIGSDDFVVYLGDVLFGTGIGKFVERFCSTQNDAQILIKKSKVPHKFGVVELNERMGIVSIEEKPEKPKSDYVIVGVYAFRESIFEAIGNISPSKRGELEITDAIGWLLKNKKQVHAEIVDTWWHDTGGLESLLEANLFVLMGLKTREINGTIEKGASVSGNVHIGNGTVIREGVSILGPAVIGANCEIGPRVFVGPYTSIGNNIRIINSEIENSIVLDDTVIENVDLLISNSIIGQKCTVLSKKKKEEIKTYTLILGDHSKMEL